MIEENPEFSLYSTNGESMYPFLRGDEHILVKKSNPEAIYPGDVVVFKCGCSSTICHRVVRVQNKDGIALLETKGDRGRGRDVWFGQEAILGKVVALNRRMKFIDLSKRNWGLLLYGLDCFFSRGVFYLRKRIAKIIFSLQQYGIYRIIARPFLGRNIIFYMLAEKNQYGFFAKKNNQIIARVYLSNFENDSMPGYWIGAMQVRFRYCRLGIGTRLLNNLMEFAKGQNILNLYRSVCKENAPAFKLYLKMGFKTIPGSERTENNRTRVYMQKTLA
jgi:GNAT superfamily N-acetyltransferase